MVQLDDLNRKILRALQRDAGQSIDGIAKALGSSRTAIWTRIRRLRQDGVIKKQTVILDPEAVGVGCCFYVLVRTARHGAAWMEAFLTALQARPEIIEAHRLAGDVDYILKVRVASPAAYDAFYRDLVADIEIHNVTSLLSMEALIDRVDLPI